MIGLYWRERRQSLEVCAELCFRSLCCLQKNGYAIFYQLSRSRKTALRHPVEPSLEAIRSLLEKGVNRRDTDRQPIPELGFRLSLWSGGPDDESYSVSVHCGCGSQFVGNNFLLDLPRSGPFSLALSQDSAFATFRELLSIWQPEKGVVCDSNELRWDNGHFASDMKNYLRYPEIANP